MFLISLILSLIIQVFLHQDMIKQNNVDTVFFGSGGRFSFSGGCTYVPAEQNKQAGELKLGSDPKMVQKHIAEWLDCMRSRKQPSADAVAGHYSAMACHIGNIAYKEQRRVTWRKEWDV